MNRLGVIRQAYSDVMYLPGDCLDVVDCLISVLVATFHPKLVEPVWVHIQAAPSGGKTEVVTPTAGYPMVEHISDLTGNALMSGYSDEEGFDPSLVAMLDGKVLIVKDWTTPVSNARELTKVLGALRDLYDGWGAKASGKVGVRKYRARFGLITCITDVLDRYAAEFQQLGERMLTFRLHRIPWRHQQRMEQLEAVHRFASNKEDLRRRLQEVVHGELNMIVSEFGGVPRIGDADRERLMLVADQLALLRTAAIDGTAVMAELGGRVYQQLLNLGLAHTIACGRSEWTEEETVLAMRMAVDSLSVVKRRVLTVLFSRGEHRPAMSAEQIALKCRASKSEVEDVMLQYVYTGVVEVEEENRAMLYRLTEEEYRVLDRIGLFRAGLRHLPVTTGVVG